MFTIGSLNAVYFIFIAYQFYFLSHTLMGLGARTWLLLIT